MPSPFFYEGKMELLALGLFCGLLLIAEHLGKKIGENAVGGLLRKGEKVNGYDQRIYAKKAH